MAVVKQFLGYVVIGGISAGLDFGIFLFFVAIHISPVIATALSFLLSSIFNYCANRSLVFKERGMRTMIRYVILVGVNAGASSGLVGLGMFVGLSPTISKGVSMVIIVGFNFVMMRRWVFSRTDSGPRTGDTDFRSVK